MKLFKFSSIIVLFFTCGIMVLPVKAQVHPDTSSKDSLTAYTGKYEMKQDNQGLNAEVYIEKGALCAKSSDGQLLQLKHVSGDSFIISDQNVPIKFIRDKSNKVVQIAVNGNIAWTRVENEPATTVNPSLTNAGDYLGKYQLKAGNQLLVIELSIKNNQLWATQLWDGGSSTLDFKSADNFIVTALSMPIKFIRDKNNKVIQLVLNNRDVFTRVN
ncbi:MAG: DUF3471 domain-containing protein [Bacteroidota bacterium]